MNWFSMLGRTVIFLILGLSKKNAEDGTAAEAHEWQDGRCTRCGGRKEDPEIHAHACTGRHDETTSAV